MLLVRLEHAALISLAVVLPLFEAPKNLLWLAWVALWLWNHRKDFGGRWDAWDTLIVAWVASGYLSAYYAGLDGGQWKGVNDLVRYASVLWLMKRGRYAERVQLATLVALLAGTVAALAWGYYGLLVTAERHSLGLKSVGHVNHSAIYLAIAFSLVVMAVRAWWSRSPAWRTAGTVCMIIFAASLVVMESRAAVGAALAAALVLLVAYSLRRGRRLWPVLVVVGALFLLGGALLAEKNLRQMEITGSVLAYRDGIWRSGMLAWREFPLFGVGMDNWSRIDYWHLDGWTRLRRETLAQGELAFSSHGHNLFVNTLVERGAVGFLVLVLVLAAWLGSLLMRLPAANAPPLEWAWWGGAAGAWMVAIVAGMANTTLHHEHALISMLLLGGWLALASSPRAIQRILVIRRDNIGDLVCTTPLFAALRQRYPGCHLAVLTNSYSAPVLEGNTDVDAVHVYEKAKHGGGGPLAVAWQRLQLVARLRGERFGTAVAFGPRAERLARLIGAARIVRPRPIAATEVEIVWTAAAELGIAGAPPPLKVVPAPEALARARAAAPAGAGPLVGVHISARKPSQRWPLERHAELMHRLHERDGSRFMLFWAPGDAADARHPGDDAGARQLLTLVGALPVASWPTATLRELIAGIAACERMIMSDGGAMHIAAALGKPIVAFFGRSDARQWRPWGVRHELLQPASQEARDVPVADALAAYERLHNA